MQVKRLSLSCLIFTYVIKDDDTSFNMQLFHISCAAKFAKTRVNIGTTFIVQCLILTSGLKVFTDYFFQISCWVNSFPMAIVPSEGSEELRSRQMKNIGRS